MEPPGPQLLDEVDQIRQALTSKPKKKQEAKRLIETAIARADSWPSPNIFQLIPPDGIEFLLGGENLEQQIYELVVDGVKHLLKMMDSNVRTTNARELALREPRLASVPPVVQDHSVREPATSTEFGHTAELKYLSYKLVRSLGFCNLAVAGLYYGDMYTVEEQFLELTLARDGPEAFEGCYVMSGPDEDDRAKAFKFLGWPGRVPNLFIDTAFMPSPSRFETKTRSNIADSVLQAVRKADDVFKQHGIAPPTGELDPLRQPHGEICINLVDMMETVNLDSNGEMQDTAAKKEMEGIFRKFCNDEFFVRRVRGILFEEGRGRALHDDYGAITRWLRKFFPEKQFLLLAHAHGGTGTENAASLEAVQDGADGIWAAFIPQAAQSGHNSSFLYLDNLRANGNPHVSMTYRLDMGIEAAKWLYSLNYQSVQFPGECPIWGQRTEARVHSAFSTTERDEWRARSQAEYDDWPGSFQTDHAKLLVKREEISKTVKRKSKLERNASRGSISVGANYRIAPLVTDAVNVGKRLMECRLLSNELGDTVDDFGQIVRRMMMAMMNAGIRVDYNSPAQLERMVRWARWARQVQGPAIADGRPSPMGFGPGARQAPGPELELEPEHKTEHQHVNNPVVVPNFAKPSGMVADVYGQTAPRSTTRPTTTRLLDFDHADESGATSGGRQRLKLAIALVAVLVVAVMLVWTSPETIEPCDGVTCEEFCAEGYSGPACENFDECFSINCGEHGSCSEGACVCERGAYSGPACETFDPCFGVDCGEHGGCGRGRCICEEGYSGLACENFDECFSINCGEHGSCSEGVCVCESGAYYGLACESFDACFEVDCGEHGACGQGRCVCEGGYSGPSCETFDACFGVECAERQSCFAGNCNCSEGFFGDSCEFASSYVISGSEGEINVDGTYLLVEASCTGRSLIDGVNQCDQGSPTTCGGGFPVYQDEENSLVLYRATTHNMVSLAQSYVTSSNDLGGFAYVEGYQPCVRSNNCRDTNPVDFWTVGLPDFDTYLGSGTYDTLGTCAGIQLAFSTRGSQDENIPTPPSTATRWKELIRKRASDISEHATCHELSECHEFVVTGLVIAPGGGR